MLFKKRDFIQNHIKFRISKVNFEVVTPIMGFEDIRELEFIRIDDNFATIRAENGISWSLANPYSLRDYKLALSISAQALLDVAQDSHLEVWCMMIIQSPLEDSRVNFLSPLILNFSNKKLLQFHCAIADYPQYFKLESLRAFIN